jgi:hypothetical protein
VTEGVSALDKLDIPFRPLSKSTISTSSGTGHCKTQHKLVSLQPVAWQQYPSQEIWTYVMPY